MGCSAVVNAATIILTFFNDVGIIDELKDGNYLHKIIYYVDVMNKSVFSAWSDLCSTVMHCVLFTLVWPLWIIISFLYGLYSVGWSLIYICRSDVFWCINKRITLVCSPIIFKLCLNSYLCYMYTCICLLQCAKSKDVNFVFPLETVHSTCIHRNPEEDSIWTC